MTWSPRYNSELALYNGKQQWRIILNKSSVKYFELKFLPTVDAKKAEEI